MPILELLLGLKRRKEATPEVEGQLPSLKGAPTQQNETIGIENEGIREEIFQPGDRIEPEDELPE